jgi:hypothetical protein
MNLDDEYIFIHKAECRGYDVDNTRGMDVEAIVSSEWCGWEYAQGIIQVWALCGVGNTLLLLCSLLLV